MAATVGALSGLAAHFLRWSFLLQFLAVLLGVGAASLLLAGVVILMRVLATPSTAKDTKRGHLIVDHRGREYVRLAKSTLPKIASTVMVLVAIGVMLRAFFPTQNQPESPDPIHALLDRKLEIIPSPQDEAPFVSAQLIPPVWEWDKQQQVTSLLVDIENPGLTPQRKVSARLSTPWIKEASCHNPDRVRIVGGGQRWAGYVHFLAEELLPSENQVCEVILLRPARFSSIAAWKRQYSREAWSESRGAFDLYLYRVAQGAEEKSGNPEYPFRRAVTFMVN